MPTSTPPDLHPAIKVPRMNGWRFIGVDILLNSALNAISHEPVSMYCRIYLGSLFVLLSIIIFFNKIYKIYFVFIMALLLLLYYVTYTSALSIIIIYGNINSDVVYPN